MSDYSTMTDEELLARINGGSVDYSKVSDADLLKRIGGVQQYPSPDGLAGLASGYVQGANRGISDVLGGPVDLISGGLRAIGVPVGDTPFLGSNSIRSAQNALTGLAQRVTGVGSEGVRATYNDINELPPGLRPSARAGEVSGQTVAMLAAPLAAARGMTAPAIAASQAPSRVANGSVLGNTWRGMVGEAATSPKAFVASQIPSTVGQALGGAGAEIAAPGSETAQLVGQLGGGLLGAGVGVAGKAASGPIENLWAKIKEPFTTVSPEGAKTAAARALRPILEQSGEDSAAILGRLQQTPVAPGLPAGEVAQSPALTGVQNYLMKDNANLKNAVTQGRTAYAENLQAGTQAAFEPGNQAALTAAAKQRQTGFVQSLDRMVSSAEQKAQAAAERVQPNDVGTRTTINTEARDLLETALTTARKQETALWQRVPKDVPVNPKNALEEFNAVKSGMLEEETLNPLLEKVMKRFSGEGVPATPDTRVAVTDPKTGKFLYNRNVPGTPAVPPGPVTSQDVQNMRSLLLDEARTLRANGQFRDANRLSRVANGADPSAEGGLLADISSINHPAVEPARAFSKALNDRFSRSYAGDVLGTKPSGAPAVRPELTLQSAVETRPDKAALQMAELRNAAPDMLPQQEQFMRDVSKSAIDSQGNVIPKEVDKLLLRHSALLDDFPQYRQSLIQARDRQTALNGVLERTGDATKLADKQAAFARVLKAGEKPADAVASALAGSNPVRDMNKLSSLAKSGASGELAVGDNVIWKAKDSDLPVTIASAPTKGPDGKTYVMVKDKAGNTTGVPLDQIKNNKNPDAVAGLRASVLEHVMGEASTKNGLSYTKVNETLNTPLSPNGPSLLKSMRDNGIINATQHAEIIRHVDAGLMSEAAKVAGVEVKEFGSGPGMWARAAARILGAKTAAAVAGGGGAGPSLQVAQIGASISEKLASRLPADRAKAMMAEALASNDTATLIDILERAGVTAYGSSKFDGPQGQFTKALVLLRTAVPKDKTDTGDRERMLYNIGNRPQGGIPIPGQTLGITIRP